MQIDLQPAISQALYVRARQRFGHGPAVLCVRAPRCLGQATAMPWSGQCFVSGHGNALCRLGNALCQGTAMLCVSTAMLCVRARQCFVSGHGNALCQGTAMLCVSTVCFVSGHGFSRAESCRQIAGFSPCGTSVFAAAGFNGMSSSRTSSQRQRELGTFCQLRPSAFE